MNEKILVAYASQSGSTASVAEAIGKTLSQQGALVDVRRMQDVTDLSGYRAVVAGSAIQGGKWLPEALQFIQYHRAALRQKPFAAFLVCISLGLPGAAKYRDGIAKWLAPVRAQVHPVSEGLFAGRLEFDRLPRSFDALMLRAAVGFGALPKGDHRDWGAIQAWAESLPPLLH